MPPAQPLLATVVGVLALGTVAAAVALDPAPSETLAREAASLPAAATFKIAGAAEADLLFRLADAAPVVVTLTLDDGEASGYEFDGPGDCVARGTALRPEDGDIVLHCGRLAAGDHAASFRQVDGTSAGTIRAELDTPPTRPVGRIERFEGEERTGASVHVPFLMCPLECRFRYMLLSDDDVPPIVVEDGAIRIVVTSTWHARHPADAFEVSLVLVEGNDGEAVHSRASGEGVGEVVLDVEAPRPGRYEVGSFPTTPAGADALRAIAHVVEVHY